MQLATLHLKLSGNPNNTIYKRNVTPAQMGLYAFMHGEDCMESLVLTGVDKERTTHEEMTRLQTMFDSEDGMKCLNKLYPGMAPHLPVTFTAIGYTPTDTSNVVSAADKPPVPDSQAEAAIADRIKSAAAERAPEAAPQQTAPVYSHEIRDLVAGESLMGAPQALELPNDPLSAEMDLMAQEASGE